MLLRFITALGLVSAAPAMAQTSPQVPAAAGDVVVIGKSRGEIDRQARQFIKSIIPVAPADEPMARFEVQTVCPIAVGLTPSLDARFIDRLRRVAVAAAIPLDKPGCRKPSALVLFADDIAPTIAMLEKRYVGLFVDEYGMPIHIAKKGPVVVWHAGDRINQNGEYLSQEENGGFLTNRTALPASRIETSSHRILSTTIVLIERRSVEGLTVTQVADYAAMRAFADTRPPNPSAGGDRAPTILTAIDTPMAARFPPPSRNGTWVSCAGFIRRRSTCAPRSSVAKSRTRSRATFRDADRRGLGSGLD